MVLRQTTSEPCFQEFKKGVQKSIQTCEHLPRICTLGPLFFNFSKIRFSKHQGPQVGVHPTISRPQKVITFRTTTNEPRKHLIARSALSVRELVKTRMLFCSCVVKKVITFCGREIGGWTPTCGPWCFENPIFEKLKKSGRSVHILGKCSQVWINFWTPFLNS